WLWRGKFRTAARIKKRIFPSLTAKVDGVAAAGTVLSFDKLYYNDGHWWLRIADGGASRFIAAGRRHGGVACPTAAARRRPAAAGTVFSFDKLYYVDGHWWLRIADGGASRFIAAGRKEDGVAFQTAAARGRLWGAVTGLDTSGGREKTQKAL